MPPSRIVGFPEREEKLRALCAHGSCYETIRKQLHCSENTVIKACQTLEIEYARKRGYITDGVIKREAELRSLRERGLTYSAIGIHFGVSKHTISKACVILNLSSQQRRSWQNDKNRLLAMLRRGMTRRQIAKELGVSRGAVIGACYRLGLSDDEQAQSAVAVKHKLVRLAREAALRERIRQDHSNKNRAKKPRVPWRDAIHAVAIPDVSTRCSILGLELGKCHYLDNEGFYCGALTGDLKESWCAYHANFVFNRGIEMSGDAGGTTQRHPRHGVELDHAASVGQCSTRPHQFEDAA